MQWIEADETPDDCKNCEQEDCYNCDIAGERWVLSKADELRTTRKLMARAVERLERKIAEIDEQLEKLQK